MARPGKIFKLAWRSKKANHGRKPGKGRHHMSRTKRAWKPANQ